MDFASDEAHAMRSALFMLIPFLGLAQEVSRNSIVIPSASDAAEKLSEVENLIKNNNLNAAANLINRLLQKPSALIKSPSGVYRPVYHDILQKARKWPQKLILLLAASQEREVHKALVSTHRTPSQMIKLVRKFPFSQTALRALEEAADVAFEAGKITLAHTIYQDILKTGKSSPFLKKKFEAASILIPKKKTEKKPYLDTSSLIPIRQFWLPSLPRVIPSFFPRSPTTYHYSAQYAFGCFYIATNNTVVELNPQTLRTRTFRAPSGVFGFQDYDYCSTCTVTKKYLFVPFIRELTKEKFNVAIPAKAYIPLRSVAVFNRQKREFLFWLHEFKGFKTRFGKVLWSIQQPPVVVGDLAYCEIKTYTNTVNSYIAVFDLREQRLLDAQIFCSNGVELTLWEFMAREPPSLPPVLSGNRLFVVSNLGAVAAFDINTNSILWVTEYDQFRIVSRFPYSKYPTYRNFCWTFSKPIVVDSLLIATPIDSPYVFAFNTKNGKMVWRFRYDSAGLNLSVLLGAVDGKVFLAGKGVVCLNARNGKLLWFRDGNGSLAMGARTKNGFIVTGLRGTIEVDTYGVRFVDNIRKRGNLCSGKGYLLIVGEREAILMGRR